MALNLPDGTRPSDIILPDGTYASEVRDADGNVVWTADHYLDMTSVDAHVDLSSHSVTLSPGKTFLVWARIYTVGSQDSGHGPGLFSVASGGDYNDFLEIWRDAGAGTASSGTETVRITGENADGEWNESWDFTMDLDNNPWQLLGLTFHSDASLTFWRNDGSLTTNVNNSNTSDEWNINYLGYGYIDSDNGGSGRKDFDAPGVWNRELTSTEIADWYNNGIVPDTPEHLWLLDNDRDSTAYDDAGSADGTVSGATYVDGGAY